MTDFWTNPWVTGIGGGIISSLIVFFVTKYFFKKKENREYVQKIKLANNEILYAIRPLIIDHKTPLRESFSSLRVSVSNKYGVKLDDLYNNISLSNDLIAEILENPFLTSEQKEDFCQLILQFKKEDESNLVEIIYLRKKIQVDSRFTSIILSLTSFAMILSMTLLVAKETKAYEPSDWEKQLFGDNITLFLTATVIPLLVMVGYYILQRLKKTIRNHSEDIDDSDD